MVRPIVEHTRLLDGTWHVRLKADEIQPKVQAYYQGSVLNGHETGVTKTPGVWNVALPLPPGVLSEGVHTILLCADKEEDAPLAHLTLIAGDIIGDDMRAEVDVLRAELDLLKSAFRRHCRES